MAVAQAREKLARLLHGSKLDARTIEKPALEALGKHFGHG